jgi:hypothetical protein
MRCARRSTAQVHQDAMLCILLPSRATQNDCRRLGGVDVVVSSNCKPLSVINSPRSPSQPVLAEESLLLLLILLLCSPPPRLRCRCRGGAALLQEQITVPGSRQHDARQQVQSSRAPHVRPASPAEPPRHPRRRRQEKRIQPPPEIGHDDPDRQPKPAVRGVQLSLPGVGRSNALLEHHRADGVLAGGGGARPAQQVN